MKSMIMTRRGLQFRAALVKTGFDTQWQRTYGAEACSALAKYRGR